MPQQESNEDFVAGEDTDIGDLAAVIDGASVSYASHEESEEEERESRRGSHKGVKTEQRRIMRRT